jgi:2-oxoglutarate dehydrogenase E2 component (dihydrolipoamide succinyltransferase)
MALSTQNPPEPEHGEAGAAPAEPNGGAASAAPAPAPPSPGAPSAGEPDEEPANGLSPAVRRLVREYDLDITGIHGTGPSGRIRVGDVMAALGARTDPSLERLVDGARPGGRDDEPARRAARAVPVPDAASAGAAVPVTTLFECDLGKVLSHRKQQRRRNVDVLLTSYYVIACSEALRAVPEAVAKPAGQRGSPPFGLVLATADGGVRTALLETSAGPAPVALEERLREVDAGIRASAAADLGPAGLLIHDYGASGSLVATPTPIGAGHTAGLGIGRVRRQMVLRSTNGDETPAVAALCYLSLSFYPDRLALHRANRFLAELVRVLEQWPEDDYFKTAAIDSAT